jgi:hypothetical protein
VEFQGFNGVNIGAVAQDCDTVGNPRTSALCFSITLNSSAISMSFSATVGSYIIKTHGL